MTTPKRDQTTSAFNDPISDLGLSAVLPQQRTFPFLEPSSEPGDLGRLAQYRVLRLLGAGGMGFVFEAEDTQLARRVALKVMRPEFASDLGFRERFLIEARAAAGLTSDYIVTVYQVGTAGDVPFQAIQLLTGESLQDRLQRKAPLSVGLTCLILRQTAEGLAAAHEKGLIHRDIKPANIWLETSNPGGPFRRARILDFGLARSDNRDTKLTATGMIVGTPHFMAPEQASGQAIDGRTDIFSLGCVAYAMLTGKLAFDGSSTMAVLMALASHTPPPLTELNPAVPRTLSTLVGSMMAKDPNLRPTTALSVCAALDSILAGIPDPYADSQVASGTGLRPIGSSRPAKSTSIAAAAPTPAPTDVFGSSALTGGGPGVPASSGRPWWPVVLGGVSLAAIAVLVGFALFGRDRHPAGNPEGGDPIATGEPIPVGILHSLSGTMSVSESPVVDATLLAIDEINAAGGVLGRRLVPVVANGESEPGKFEKAAERLLLEDKAAVIFGCWTSSSRKAVRPIVERHNGLLFYPVQYEGLEQSPHIVYLGPAPNQQLGPAIDFLVQRQGKKRLFLVGSDYVYPRAAHEIVKDEVKGRKGSGAQFVGEAFLTLGTKDVAMVVAAIEAAAPDAILNTINGTTNFHFFQELNGVPATAGIPVLSVSMMEPDVRRLDLEGVAGDFLAGTYFEGVGSASGKDFLVKFRQRYGQERRYSDALAAAYCGVHLWAKAVAASRSLESEVVTKALRGMSFDGPAGEVKIDSDILHCWLPARIGRIRPDGGVEPVDESRGLLRPDPYPPTRTRAEWDVFLNNLFLKWDGRWQAPGP